MKIVTFSRNVFIPLTNACRNRCAYCGFRSDDHELMTPSEVKSLLSKAKNASEALFTFGERPDVYDDVKRKLKAMGYSNFLELVRDVNELAVKMGFLPHTNAGVLSYEELKKLKPYNASMGLMLEQAVELECHALSPGKKPEVRVKTIKNAGKLRIPFTTGILIGIGEKPYDRIYSLEVIADVHANYGHIQEVIIQPFQPKKGTPMQDWKPPSGEELLEVVRKAREILPEDIAIQIPPNLVGDVYPFLKAGANDLGGISEVTPDYINPEHPWPSVSDLKAMLRNEFLLRERLPIYPKFVRLRWFSDEIADLIYRLADEEGLRCSTT